MSDIQNRLRVVIAHLDRVELPAMKAVVEEAKENISRYQSLVKDLEIDRDTWMGKYTILKNSIDGE